MGVSFAFLFRLTLDREAQPFRQVQDAELLPGFPMRISGSVLVDVMKRPLGRSFSSTFRLISSSPRPKLRQRSRSRARRSSSSTSTKIVRSKIGLRRSHGDWPAREITAFADDDIDGLRDQAAAGTGDFDGAVKDGDGNDIVLIGLQALKHVTQAVGIERIDGALEGTALHLFQNGIVIMKTVHRKQCSRYAFTCVQRIDNAFGNG